jgi:hypothetical protein
MLQAESQVVDKTKGSLVTNTLAYLSKSSSIKKIKITKYFTVFMHTR